MLTAAIVGLGWWGKHIVHSLKDSEKIRTKCGVEVDLDGTRPFAVAANLELTEDYNSVLTDPSIGAVIIATPHSLHEPQVIAAAEAGKAVFCEKPLALSTDGARRMLAACEANGVLLGVGHERRFEGALEAMKKLHDEGRLGTLLHLEGNWSHDDLARHRVAGWRSDPSEAPAGLLTGLGVHLTDYFQSVAGPVDTVFALTERRSQDVSIEDVLTVHFRFVNGVTGTMCNLASTPFYCRINAFGDLAWAEARRRANVDEAEPTELTVCGRNGEPKTDLYEASDPVRANLHEWADAVEGRGKYRFTAQEKLHNVEILDAIVASVRFKHPVKVA